MSLPQGIPGPGLRADRPDMSAAVLTEAAPAAASRILADVNALDESDPRERETAIERLEAALGRDFADRLVAALSDEGVERDPSAD